MKKIIFCLLAGLLLLTGSVQGQGFHGGIKVGANIAQLDGDTWDNGYRVNLLGGLYAAINGRRAGIQIEALFSQSKYVTGKNFNQIGSQYYNNVKDSLKQGNFRVNYLNIPVLLQLRFSKVWLQVGPQYSGVVSVDDMDHLLKDASQLFKGSQISGVVGLNVDLTKNLNFGARYVFGLSDANNTTLSQAWKQRNIQVHIGVGF